MSLSLNLNASALNTHDALAATNSALSNSIAKLSSGYKINSAADDPAGLVISENLRAQMSGLTQAVANSQDGVNLVKTAEGALTQVNTLLTSMRALAVHAANAGANSASAISADQAQIASAIQSLNNISANTAFGNQKLLNGSGGQTFTVLNPSAVTSATVGTGAGSVFAGKTGAVNITATAATQTKVTGGVTYATAGTALAANDTIYVNGTKIGDFTTSNKASDVVTAINNQSSSTGVTAAFVTDHIELTSVKYGSAQTISLSESSAGIATGGGLHTGAAGADAAITAGSIGGVALTAPELATFSTKVGNTISNSAGDTITLAAGSTGGTGVANLAGSALTFQIGANAGETASVSIASTAASNLGTNSGTSITDLSKIDVTTDASDAIKVIDSAIAQVATQRANIGAFQTNVLQSNINSLNVTNENVTASESSIRDTDMAAEMTNFTRLNILDQAGIAMLTQANQQPQQLLSLLKG
jgi:flagellin